MKKALMYASVASMIQQFNMNNIKILQDLGYKVDVACNFEFGSTISKEKIDNLKNTLKEMNIDFYHIPIPRKITDLHNLNKSYKLTKELINRNEYNLIHCHSPIGGIICRVANKNSNNYEYSKMIYTAHGFHFFKGNNPLKNFLFRNIEKYGAKYTDILITINKEDYEAAKKFKLRNNGKVEYVPGIGIDLDKINALKGNKEELCKELSISNDSLLLLSVGELSKRKNHEIIIRLLPSLSKNIHYLICGQGSLEMYLADLSKKLNVTNRVHFLGYKENIIEIMKSCDCFIFPSLQEGLPVALMEAIAAGMPCIASNIRGNSDLINNQDGILVDSAKEWSFKLNGYMKKLDSTRMENISILKYGKDYINRVMNDIYEDSGKEIGVYD